MKRLGLFALLIFVGLTLFFSQNAEAQCFSSKSVTLGESSGSYTACNKENKHTFEFTVGTVPGYPMVQTQFVAPGASQDRTFTADDYLEETHTETWWGTKATSTSNHSIAIDVTTGISDYYITAGTYTVRYYAGSAD